MTPRSLASWIALSLIVSGSWACIDVKLDCGAHGNGVGDDTVAFEQCIAKAHTKGGCVMVTAGTYPITCFAINISDVHMFFDPGATLNPPKGYVKGCASAGLVQIGSSKDASPAHNVTVLGVGGGQFTIDCTLQATIRERVAAIRVNGNVRDVVIGNVRTKMAYPLFPPPSTHEKALNTNALAFGNTLVDGTSYHTVGGHVFNITNTGSWEGYALVQVQSLENTLFEHLDSTGGVTLRLETGVQLPGSYVGNITGKDITCRSGANAFEASPHAQQNGNFFVSDVKSFSCFTAINLVAGYIQNNATVPGFFGNGSLVHGVVATFGNDSQCDDACRLNKLNGSSCAACIQGENKAHPDSQLGYTVDVQGVSAVGFPPAWKHDYSTCAVFNRHKEDCSYWPAASLPPI